LSTSGRDLKIVDITLVNNNSLETKNIVSLFKAAPKTECFSIGSCSWLRKWNDSF